MTVLKLRAMRNLGGLGMRLLGRVFGRGEMVSCVGCRGISKERFEAADALRSFFFLYRIQREHTIIVDRIVRLLH